MVDLHMIQEQKNDARVDGSFILTTDKFIGRYPLKKTIFTHASFDLSQNYLSTKESLWVFGENNDYSFVTAEEGGTYTEERAPSDHPDYNTSQHAEHLVRIVFTNAPSYTDNTFKAGTVIDIFSRVLSYVTGIYYVMKFLLGLLEPLKDQANVVETLTDTIHLETVYKIT